jgi:WD40 repeat protein
MTARFFSIEKRSAADHWLALPVLLFFVLLSGCGPAAGQQPVVLPLLEGFIHGVAFSPDGKTIATGSSDGKAILWDADTAKKRLTIAVGHGNVLSVAFSPDGKVLATGNLGQTVRLWDVETGKEDVILENQQLVNGGTSSGHVAVAFAPDGKTLASTSNGVAFESMRTEGCKVLLWDTKTGKQTAALTGHSGSIYSLAWSPDGKTIASGSRDKTVRLWDTASGKEEFRFSQEEVGITSVAFSPNGKLLAVAGGDDTKAEGKAVVKLWDVAERKEKWSIDGMGPIAYSPDGKRLAFSSKHIFASLCDVGTGKPEGQIGVKMPIACLSFSPDGKRLAVGQSMDFSVLDVNQILRDRPSTTSPKRDPNPPGQTD